jgi:hypothetical protein
LTTLNNSGDLKGNPPDSSENGILIHSISKLNEDKEKLWTEMIRLLIAHADERHDSDLQEYED